MISGSIAGCWRVIGNDTVLVPIILGMLFTFATVGLATSSLAALRTRSQGYLAGLILLCTPLLITHGASQYLDIPLGYFFLATIVLLNLQSRFSDKEFWLLPLAGFTAGLSAWTKNEGILFILVVLAARFITIVPRQGLKVYLKQTLRMAAGLLPVLVVLAYFKMRLATPALLLASGEQSAFEKILDLSRYSQIFDAFKSQALGFGGWPVSVLLLLVFYILLLGVKVDQRERSSVLASALILALMMLGYFFIFVITPRELAWHLASTLDRLFVQLFPSFVFFCFMLARAPEQAIEEEQNLTPQVETT